MSVSSKTGNKAHDDAGTAAEGVRQVSSAPGSTQAQVKAADIAFHRAVIASAKTNCVPIPTPSIDALRESGVGGA